MLKNVLSEEWQRVKGPLFPSWLLVCVAFVGDPSTVPAPGSDGSIPPAAPASENMEPPAFTATSTHNTHPTLSP